MNLFTFFSLLSTIGLLLLALIILKFGNLKNVLHRVLMLLNLSLAVWNFGCTIVGFSGSNLNAAILGWKIAHIGAFVCAVFVLHISLLLTNAKRSPFLFFSYFAAILLPILAFANLLDVKWQYILDSCYYITPIGITYPLFILVFIINGIYATVLFYRGYRRSGGQRRTQFKYLLIALLIGYWGGSTHFLTVFGIYVYPIGFGNFLIGIFPLVTTYAILKHKLLDIEVIIKRTLVFAGLLASVFGIIVLPTLLIQEYIFGTAGLGVRLLGLSISGIIIIFSMRRIEDFLVNVTDKFLFQKKYDYKELLKTFTSEVLTVLDLNKLVKLTVDKLTDIIKLQSCGILLLDEETKRYRLAASQGIREKSISLGMDNTLTSFLARTKMCLSVKAHGKEYRLPERIIQDMNRLKLELAIPLMTLQDEMIGILTLGAKKSDENYTQDDMDILLPLARTLAIAISNAEMFDELGKTQAEAAQREKMAVIGTLSAGINHEICNPLGIARGQCEAFLLNMKDGLYKNKTPKELIDKAQIIMNKVIHETDRATSITKRLSSFAKPSKGVISNDINIKDEIDEVLALVGYELKLDKIDIAKEVNEGIPFITGDKKQLQEVFFNLIRNAAQAISERGRITVRAKEEYGKIIIEIEDTGHGIPQGKINQIFNPFYTTKEPGKGTGLGLFIVRQVVERNGGKISVKSVVGKGTTFTLEFSATIKAKA